MWLTTIKNAVIFHKKVTQISDSVLTAVRLNLTSAKRLLDKVVSRYWPTNDEQM